MCLMFVLIDSVFCSVDSPLCWCVLFSAILHLGFIAAISLSLISFSFIHACLQYGQLSFHLDLLSFHVKTLGYSIKEAPDLWGLHSRAWVNTKQIITVWGTSKNFFLQWICRFTFPLNNMRRFQLLHYFTNNCYFQCFWLYLSGCEISS